MEMWWYSLKAPGNYGHYVTLLVALTYFKIVPQFYCGDVHPMWAQAGEQHTCIFAASDVELPRNKKTICQFVTAIFFCGIRASNTA